MKNTVERHPETRELRPDEEDPVGGDGDCYESAFKYLMENHRDDPTLRLVHAVCLIGVGPHEGLPFGHAWCERIIAIEIPPELTARGFIAPNLEWVEDRSNGKEVSMPAALYYHGGRPVQIHRYTWEEAAKWAVKTGHYGHWELEVDR